MYRRISLCITLFLCLWVFASCDWAEDGSAMMSDTAKQDESQFVFSFTVVDGDYYLSYDEPGSRSEMIEVPGDESKLYALVVDGSFIPVLPTVKNDRIMIPSKVFADYIHSEYISVESLVSAGCEVSIIEMDSNSRYGYELNAVVVETNITEPKYTVEDAQEIIYDKIKAKYEDLVKQINTGGEVTLTHTDDRLAAICADAEEYSISTVEYCEDFGRYYVFTGTKFGYSIYFNKYTGEIFSDNTANTINSINIRRGIYSLDNLYW